MCGGIAVSAPALIIFLGFSTQSVVCVPIVNGRNKVIGAIELINEISPEQHAMGTVDIFTDVALLVDRSLYGNCGGTRVTASENR